MVENSYLPALPIDEILPKLELLVVAMVAPFICMIITLSPTDSPVIFSNVTPELLPELTIAVAL